MTVIGKVLVLATVLSGATMVGVALAQTPLPPLPVAPLSREALAEKLMPAPRLLKTETRKGEAPGIVETTLACVDKGTFASLSPTRQAGAAPSPDATKGCVQTIDRAPDGHLHTEMTCDVAKGARVTAHSVTDSGPGVMELRQHLEVERQGPGASGTMVRDVHMALAGECPAGLQSGQMRLADGTVRPLTRNPLAGPDLSPK